MSLMVVVLLYFASMTVYGFYYNSTNYGYLSDDIVMGQDSVHRREWDNVKFAVFAALEVLFSLAMSVVIYRIFKTIKHVD